MTVRVANLMLIFICQLQLITSILRKFAGEEDRECFLVYILDNTLQSILLIMSALGKHYAFLPVTTI